MGRKLIYVSSDRSIGLEKRKDLTGRLVRLMSSTYMTACNDAAGKLLFCLCEQDRMF